VRSNRVNADCDPLFGSPVRASNWRAQLASELIHNLTPERVIRQKGAMLLSLHLPSGVDNSATLSVRLQRYEK